MVGVKTTHIAGIVAEGGEGTSATELGSTMHLPCQPDRPTGQRSESRAAGRRNAGSGCQGDGSG